MATLAAQLVTDFTTLNSSGIAQELIVTDPDTSKVSLAATFAAAETLRYAGDDGDSTDTVARMYGMWFMLTYLADVLQVKFTAAGQEKLRECRVGLEDLRRGRQQENATIRTASRTADDDIDDRYGRS